MKTVIENRLIVALAQRGNVGKSTLAVCLAQWLDHHAVMWRGHDLDTDHRSFSRLFPTEVQAVPMGEEPTADVVKVLRMATNAPVVVVDPRAHMSALLRDAFELTRFPASFLEKGGRITVVLFPADDLEIMADLDATISRFGDTVDYLVVRNLARAPHTRMLDGSELDAELKRLRAGFIDLPPLLSIARNHLAAKESELSRGLTPVEAVANKTLGFDPMIRVILEDWLRMVFRRFDAVASLLLPTAHSVRVGGAVDNKVPSGKIAARRGAKLNFQQL